MRAKRGGLSKFVVCLFLLLWLIVVAIGYFSKHSVAVLDPAGTIGYQERNLIFFALALCSIVVIPVFALAIFIAIRYRETAQKKVAYSPNWDSNRWLEGAWWGVPMVIITVLAVVTWTSSYKLDPYKALVSSQKPLNVQVVALDWKWLFIYPDQNVASVNWLELPLNRPVDFHVTSDSVMNSFWIPSLGSQIYAMPGMDTRLHLEANKIGNYRGSSANISGSGFASMHFTAAVSPASDFNNWITKAKAGNSVLNDQAYRKLSKPSQNNSAITYSSTTLNLYDSIVASYIGPLGAASRGGHH